MLATRIARRRARLGPGSGAAPTAALLAALVLPLEARAEPVDVFFPRGNCASGRLELEMWERGADGAQGRWVLHPTLPHFDVETCQRVESRILLNEIRVRCIDPAGFRKPSSWVVGADVTGRVAASCPPSGPAPREAGP